MIEQRTHQVGEMVNIGDDLVMSVGPLARAGVLDGRNRIGLGIYHRGNPRPTYTAIIGKGCEIIIHADVAIKVLSAASEHAIRLEYDVPSDMQIDLVTPREAHIAKQSGYALIKQGPMAGQPVMRLHDTGAADPHILLMIVLLMIGLFVPMTAALMAQSDRLRTVAPTPISSSTPIIEQLPPVDPVNAPLLGSISAVVIATLFTVNVIKGLLADCGPRMKWATMWPTWSYAVIVAAIYTGLANLAFGTLHGSLGALVWQSVYNAAIASGFFEWYRHRSSSIADAGGKFADPRKGSEINMEQSP